MKIVLRAAAALWLSFAAFAHGGAEHVMGTVEKVTESAVTVKTMQGKSVTVMFGPKTILTKDKKAIAKADIKAGDRAVIHAEPEGKSLVAETVEIGAGETAAGR